MNDDDEQPLPTKFEVCPRCEGKGTHVNPSIDGNGLTQADFDEAGPEFLEDYLAGAYDVPCYECKGQRVVAVPDFSRMTPEQRVQVERKQREEAEYQALVAMERRYQC